MKLSVFLIGLCHNRSDPWTGWHNPCQGIKVQIKNFATVSKKLMIKHNRISNCLQLEAFLYMWVISGHTSEYWVLLYLHKCKFQFVRIIMQMLILSKMFSQTKLLSWRQKKTRSVGFTFTNILYSLSWSCNLWCL